MSSLYILGINSLDKSLVNIFPHSMAQIVKNLPAMWEIWSISGSGRPRFDPWRREWLPLEYSCLENPMDRGACGLQPMGSQRFGHNWVTNTFTFLSLAHSVGGPFFLLMASFAFQKLFSLFRSHLVISAFFFFSLGDRPTKYCYDLYQRVFCLCFPLGVLWYPVLYLGLFFGVYCVCGVREYSAVQCLVPQLCRTLCNPRDCSMPGFPALHHLPELAQAYLHRF